MKEVSILLVRRMSENITQISLPIVETCEGEMSDMKMFHVEAIECDDEFCILAENKRIASEVVYERFRVKGMRLQYRRITQLPRDRGVS